MKVVLCVTMRHEQWTYTAVRLSSHNKLSRFTQHPTSSMIQVTQLIPINSIMIWITFGIKVSRGFITIISICKTSHNFKA